MANTFGELISKHLSNLMEEVARTKGKESAEYKALYYQYVKTDQEDLAGREHNQKHYEAIVGQQETGLRFVERLYKRQATVDLTWACSAHCRYCLRQNYEPYRMSDEDERDVVNYLANDKFLKEVLITGGDPLLDYKHLIHLMKDIIAMAPNIRIIRIGTRLPVQNPLLLSDEVLRFFSENRDKVFFEVAMQMNHAVEFQSETENCIRELQKAGVTIYSQNVLLKNVNDSLDALIELYDLLRYQHIESHYIFHPVPMARTTQFRMPLLKFLQLAQDITASGEIPGRSKPMFSIMTDVGKCTLYQGSLLAKDDNGYYDISTSYRLEDRQKWNPNYVLPDNARIGEDGKIIVKYLDGEL